MPRREYGSGSVYRRSSDGRWIGVLEAGFNPDGSRRRVTVSAKTETDCKRRLRDKRDQIRTEGTTDANPRTTVRQWADQWLTARQPHLRPETMTSHTSAVRRWIVPVLGQRRLDALTPADVRLIEKRQREAGRSSSTLLRTRVVLNAMLKDAREEGHLVPARVVAVKKPSAGFNDRQALTVPEAIRVLDVASRLPDGSRWVVALLQAMRPGECLGLEWDRVDFDLGLIDVSWQLQNLPYIDRKKPSLGFRVPDAYEARRLHKSWHLTRPKTRKGWRVIPMVPWVAASLQAWRDVAPPSPHGLVWTRADGQPLSDADDADEWRAVQGTAEVGHPAGRYYVPHETRHTTVSLLIEARVDRSVVAAIVGQSKLLDAYVHVDHAQTLSALERVAERLTIPM